MATVTAQEGSTEKDLLNGGDNSNSEQKVGGNEMEFPEIEPVKDEEDPPPKPRTGLGKKRFTSLAVRVMAQLSLNKQETIAEEEEDNMETKKDTDQQATKQKSPAKKVNRAPGRNKFASLVRLAKYKRMANRPISGSTNSDESTKEQEKIDLPEKPRFSAMLSPEAQYAMLKGYEDLLLKGLKVDSKKEPQPKDPLPQPQTLVPPAPITQQHSVLYRVKTPHKNVVSLHLNGLEQKTPSTEYEQVVEIMPRASQESSRQVVGRRQSWDIRPAPYYGQLYRIDPKDDSISNSTVKAKKENLNKALLPRISTIQIEQKDKTVPKDKQLLLTHRFHCAMDILDKMRESQGLIVTSPRYKQRTINPPDNYNAWSREWSREFKLQYNAK